MDELIRKILIEAKDSKWNLENLIKVASQYKTANEFKKNSYAAYQAAHKYGYWEEVSKNFVSPLIKWTKEMVQRETEKYSTNRDFAKKSPKAYKAVVTNGWIDDIRKNFVPLGNRNKRMVYVYEFPDKSVYVGLTFDENQRKIGHTIKGTVFNYIKKTGLKPEYKNVSLGYIPVVDAQNMEECVIEDYRFRGWRILNIAKSGGLGACERKWTKDNIKKEAKKYNSYQQFYKESPIASRVAQEQGWISEIMNENGWELLRKEWTKDEILDIAKKYSYKYEFEINEPNAYSASKRQGWFDEVTNHMEDRYTQWTKEMVQDIASQYKTRTEFAKNNKNAYSAAVRNGWLDEITTHMSSPYKKWTFEEIKELSKKYPTRTRFKTLDRNPYTVAYRNGWIDILYPLKK